METFFCETCERETTHARGYCTICVRREENRKAGMVWLGLGVPLVLWSLLTFAWPSFTFGLSLLLDVRDVAVSVLLILVGLIATGRGALMMMRGTAPPQ